MADHDHDDHEEHDHDALHYLGARVDDETLARLEKVHPALAENLRLTLRFPELTDEEKAKVVETQRRMEGHPAWTPGYHAEGDTCVGCGEPTRALFADRFQEGELPYAAFVANLPVHPDRGCLATFAKAHGNLPRQAQDRLRRTHAKDLERPTAALSQFFRHDVLAQPPFTLEDWGNAVADANRGSLDRAAAKDIQRLLHWVHYKLHH